MPDVKIHSSVEKRVWSDLRALASESHDSISSLLTRAIEEYVARRRVRPEVLRHLEDSMRDHRDLGRRLAR